VVAAVAEGIALDVGLAMALGYDNESFVTQPRVAYQHV